MMGQFGLRLAESRRVVLACVRRLDQSKRRRFLAVAIVFTPLIVFTKWFAVIHGAFKYDDFDMLLVARRTPLGQSLLAMHGDVVLPLFRLFFAGMYTLFGVDELYWNLYFLFLILAVQLAALAILVAVGADIVVAALFYMATLSASVWSYTGVGYYSMSIYPQIGLLGLIGVLAIIAWRSGGSPNFRWLALAVSAAAPFIHPSGAYVPVAVAGFAYVYQLGLPGGRWSPLRMFDPEFRLLTIGLAACVAAFAILFKFAVQGGPFLSMAHSPLSAWAIVRSMFLLLSQGAALEHLRPLVIRIPPHIGIPMHGVIAIGLVLGCIVAALRLERTQRWTFLALLVPSLAVMTVVSFGRRLNSVVDVVSTAGKYTNFAYLWFSLALFYLAGCLVPMIPAHRREASRVIAAVVVCAFFVVRCALPGLVLDGPLRKQERDSLVAAFAGYAARTAPEPMHIPSLDGPFIYARYESLYLYNLGMYRPFFEGFDDRLTLLRNDAMGTWGIEGTTETVPSLRRATDPDFIRALRSDRDLQSLYLSGIDMMPLDKPRLDGEPVSFDTASVSGADSLTASEHSLSLVTAGGASVVLRRDRWDPEQAHIISMRINALPADPKRGEAVQVEVAFEGELAIPYAANRIALPKDGGDVSVDLLQLYSFSLNPEVGMLRLRFPRAGAYTITDVRLISTGPEAGG